MLPALLLVLAGPANLDALKWKARPVIVFGNGPLAEEQRKILRDPGFKARDVVVLNGTPALAKRLGVEPKDFLFVLVGKDGGTKLISSKVVVRKRLFATIDAMPMRSDEMRRKG